MSRHDSTKIENVKVMLKMGVDGTGIATIEKTGTVGNVDTYTITLDDGRKSTFTVTNGTSIESIEKTSSVGLVDTYTITLTDGSTSTFEVTNGAGGMSAHLVITSDAGSTVTVTTPSGNVITATQVTGSTTQWECDTSEYGVHTIDAVLAGDDAQMTLMVDTCKVYNIDDSHFHATITVTYPSGATCRCQGGGENYYATGSPYTFSVHSATTYTITVSNGTLTRIENVVITTSGQSESITITLIPDGSTVTPTDDVQTWLNCADIWNKTYTTIAEVLADSTTLLALMSDNNAVDYLVRSTTWATDICANQTAMTDIDANDYCANTLLDNSTWLSAICNSTYFETVLNVKVPTMTSNTTPSGECVASGEYQDQPAWHVFDKDNITTWANNVASFPAYVGYHFNNSIKVGKVAITQRTLSSYAGTTQTASIQGSNDGVTWVDVTESLTYIVCVASNPQTFEYVCDTSNSYNYFRLNATANSRPALLPTCAELQFYGRASS